MHRTVCFSPWHKDSLICISFSDLFIGLQSHMSIVLWNIAVNSPLLRCCDTSISKSPLRSPVLFPDFPSLSLQHQILLLIRAAATGLYILSSVSYPYPSSKLPCFVKFFLQHFFFGPYILYTNLCLLNACHMPGILQKQNELKSLP